MVVPTVPDDVSSEDAARARMKTVKDMFSSFNTVVASDELRKMVENLKPVDSVENHAVITYGIF